jgi:hypothetical protein
MRSTVIEALNSEFKISGGTSAPATREPED